MPDEPSESKDSHNTTVKYSHRTKEFLEKEYPDALSDADAIRHAIGDARKFLELLENADVDSNED